MPYGVTGLQWDKNILSENGSHFVLVSIKVEVTLTITVPPDAVWPFNTSNLWDRKYNIANMADILLQAQQFSYFSWGI